VLCKGFEVVRQGQNLTCILFAALASSLHPCVIFGLYSILLFQRSELLFSINFVHIFLRGTIHVDYCSKLLITFNFEITDDTIHVEITIYIHL